MRDLLIPIVAVLFVVVVGGCGSPSGGSGMQSGVCEWHGDVVWGTDTRIDMGLPFIGRGDVLYHLAPDAVSRYNCATGEMDALPGMGLRPRNMPPFRLHDGAHVFSSGGLPGGSGFVVVDDLGTITRQVPVAGARERMQVDDEERVFLDSVEGTCSDPGRPEPHGVLVYQSTGEEVANIRSSLLCTRTSTGRAEYFNLQSVGAETYAVVSEAGAAADWIVYEIDPSLSGDAALTERARVPKSDGAGSRSPAISGYGGALRFVRTETNNGLQIELWDPSTGTRTWISDRVLTNGTMVPAGVTAGSALHVVQRGDDVLAYFWNDNGNDRDLELLGETSTFDTFLLRFPGGGHTLGRPMPDPINTAYAIDSGGHVYAVMQRNGRVPYNLRRHDLNGFPVGATAPPGTCDGPSTFSGTYGTSCGGRTTGGVTSCAEVDGRVYIFGCDASSCRWGGRECKPRPDGCRPHCEPSTETCLYTCGI